MNSFCRESVILSLHLKVIFSARVGLVVVCPGCWHYSIPGTALILLPSLCWLHPMAASTYLHNIYTLYIYISTYLLRPAPGHAGGAPHGGLCARSASKPPARPPAPPPTPAGSTGK